MLSNEAEDWIRGHGWKLVVFAMCIAGLWYAYGWWVRPPAVEYDNLRYIQLLSTAVSARNADWLAKVEGAVEIRHQDGEMSDRELQAFQKILAVAADEKWKEAEFACYELAKAQLNRRRSQPASSDHEHDHDHEPKRELTRSP